MKPLRVLFLGIAACALFLPQAGNAEQLTRAALLSISCAGCHGTDGASPGSIPSIGGKEAAFIEKALKDFRSGKEFSTVMGRHAKGYTDEEVKLIAEYFSKK